MTAYIVSISMLILFLLAVGAFFSMTETAFTSLSRIKVRQLQKEKARHADLIAKLRSNLDELIATVLIGTNFVNTFNSAVTTAFAVKVLGAEYVSAATAVILFLVIIFVEIVPKTFAAINTETAVKNTAIPVYLIKAVLYPVVKTFCLFTRFIDFAEKKIFKSKRVLITEDELKTLIEVGEKEGTLEQSERKMLERLFEFSDLNVHSIMRHRSLVKYISTESSLDEVIAIFQTTGYSRIPVYENDVENIVGVLHFKSVLFASPLITASKDFIKICMAEPAFVPETMSAIDLLKKFKKEKINFAVAVNEYGGMAGIVTLDDILSEVFGRITDEHGTVEVSPEDKITVIGTNEFIVPGDMKLDDLNDVLNINLSSETFDTLGGWLLEQFDELPPVGKTHKKSGVLYIVEDQSQRRIQTVRIKL
ncbi:MAG: HlyC/CorC family transporter [Treponema sp.]|uniref:hemolysin family protein n=1 Tax=Treponema sp. TaxID=166 RepID=UPI001D30F89B|nr:hemolysin family protein [Treponema sp.]MBS7242196.1 HlyC/CorC family transporter [Treponema sp.]